MLELTDVALDDGMLVVLGECLSSVRRLAPPRSSSACAVLASEGGGGSGGVSASAGDTADGAVGQGGADVTEVSPAGGGMWGSVVSLRTLILGHCGGVSEEGFDTFLALMGGGGGGWDAPATTRRGGKGGGSSGEGGDVVGRGPAPGMALSSVRLKGCRALGDRGLALLCGGAGGMLSDVQVSRGGWGGWGGGEARIYSARKLTYHGVGFLLWVHDVASWAGGVSSAYIWHGVYLFVPS